MTAEGINVGYNNYSKRCSHDDLFSPIILEMCPHNWIRLWRRKVASACHVQHLRGQYSEPPSQV